tara:strand:- start:116703 stop:117197 length:495 start_codon:yes stop_codon:yes gene_type:complete
MNETIDDCCPVFDVEKWNHKEFKWNQKKFIKESIPEFFHIPFPPMIGKRVTKMMKLVEDSACLNQDKKEILLLFKDRSPFIGEIYLSVTDTVPNAKNVMLSGTYMSRVFDGAFKEVPKFIKKMNSYLMEQNKKAKNYYIHYAYCPKCAEKGDHNYMILFAELML